MDVLAVILDLIERNLLTLSQTQDEIVQKVTVVDALGKVFFLISVLSFFLLLQELL